MKLEELIIIEDVQIEDDFTDELSDSQLLKAIENDDLENFDFLDDIDDLV